MQHAGHGVISDSRYSNRSAPPDAAGRGAWSVHRATAPAPPPQARAPAMRAAARRRKAPATCGAASRRIRTLQSRRSTAASSSAAGHREQAQVRQAPQPHDVAHREVAARLRLSESQPRDPLAALARRPLPDPPPFAQHHRPGCRGKQSRHGCEAGWTCRRRSGRRPRSSRAKAIAKRRAAPARRRVCDVRFSVAQRRHRQLRRCRSHRR